MDNEKQFEKMKVWALLIKIAFAFILTFLVFFIIDSYSNTLGTDQLNFWFNIIFHLTIIILLFLGFKKYNIRLRYVTGDLSIVKESWISLIGIKVLLIIFSLLSVIAIISVIGFIDANIYKEILIEEPENMYGESTKYIILTFIMSFTLVPIMEELLFRGYLFNKWGESIGVTRAMILSSFLFALIHLDSGFIGHFVSGLFFTMVYLKTNKIIIPIILHGINNFIVGVALFSLPEEELAIKGEILLETINEMQFVLNILALIFVITIPIVWYVLYRYFRETKKITPYNSNKKLKEIK